jgi:hypothetical protein
MTGHAINTNSKQAIDKLQQNSIKVTATSLIADKNYCHESSPSSDKAKCMQLVLNINPYITDVIQNKIINFAPVNYYYSAPQEVSKSDICDQLKGEFIPYIDAYTSILCNAGEIFPIAIENIAAGIADMEVPFRTDKNTRCNVVSIEPKKFIIDYVIPAVNEALTIFHYFNREASPHYSQLMVNKDNNIFLKVNTPCSDAANTCDLSYFYGGENEETLIKLLFGDLQSNIDNINPCGEYFYLHEILSALALWSTHANVISFMIEDQSILQHDLSSLIDRIEVHNPDCEIENQRNSFKQDKIAYGYGYRSLLDKCPISTAKVDNEQFNGKYSNSITDGGVPLVPFEDCLYNEVEGAEYSGREGCVYQKIEDDMVNNLCEHLSLESNANVMGCFTVGFKKEVGLQKANKLDSALLKDIKKKFLSFLKTDNSLLDENIAECKALFDVNKAQFLEVKAAGAYQAILFKNAKKLDCTNSGLHFVLFVSQQPMLDLNFNEILLLNKWSM